MGCAASGLSRPRRPAERLPVPSVLDALAMFSEFVSRRLIDLALAGAVVSLVGHLPLSFGCQRQPRKGSRFGPRD